MDGAWMAMVEKFMDLGIMTAFGRTLNG